jgi:hypothetical protein
LDFPLDCSAFYYVLVNSVVVRWSAHTMGNS